MHDANDEHKPWPWNPALLHCPKDSKYHRFGCSCVRANPELLPASLHAWYKENWQAQRTRSAR